MRPELGRLAVPAPCVRAYVCAIDDDGLAEGRGNAKRTDALLWSADTKKASCALKGNE